MVPLISVSTSSSPRMASCKCLGVMRLTFKSLLAFPANSNTSAVRYSNIAAVYTAAVAPTLPFAATLNFSSRCTLPTGNCTKIHMQHSKNWLNTWSKPQSIYFFLQLRFCFSEKRKTTRESINNIQQTSNI